VSTVFYQRYSGGNRSGGAISRDMTQYKEKGQFVRKTLSC